MPSAQWLFRSGVFPRMMGATWASAGDALLRDRRRADSVRYMFDFLAIALVCWVPWAITGLPLAARVACVLTAGLLGLFFWIWGLWRGWRSISPAKAPRYVSVAEKTLVGVAATLWIAIASYSAQVSICPTILIYTICGLGVAGPLVLTLCCCRPARQDAGAMRVRALLWVMVVVSMMCARPGRRFSGGEDRPAICDVARTTGDARAAAAWVHGHISREAAPFTDTAIDTLNRGFAHCGGMANLLDKILKASGIESRIVHIENGHRIHTLVEYREGTAAWILADPQDNILGADHGNMSGWALVTQSSLAEPPASWNGYLKLYIYSPRDGYCIVTSENVHDFYSHDM